MRILAIFGIICLGLALATPWKRSVSADICNADDCKLPNCRCESSDAPTGIPMDKMPQFVFLTFDDAVTAVNAEFYKKAFYDRKNPDGCPVSSTLFIAHEYSDYSKVHELYINNQELALHSITHFPQTSYWANITVDQLKDEFGGERDLISKFANVPKEEMKGMRLPFLQLSGDNSFQAMEQLGLKYDCSWPTRTFVDPGLWPYTLDYGSSQECPVGLCPKDPIPGAWVAPMLDWFDLEGVPCSMVDGCVNKPTDNVDELLDWYKSNFNRNYKGNKAPFGFYVHAAWFAVDPFNFDAYIKFVDYLQTLPDVFIVGIERGIQWIQNPVPIGSPNWPACPEVKESNCSVTHCTLRKEKEERYMTICNGPCPINYPWLGNPLGE